MKKAGKIVSYLLVLTMVTGLFAWIGIATSSATEAKAGTKFTVLEIVPDMNMATFGYLVAGEEPTVNGKDVLANCIDTVYGTSFLSYLSTSGYGSLKYKDDAPTEIDKYLSTDYFKTNVLSVAGITKDVEVNTKTPGTLGDDDIDAADMIVISQTVPADLQCGKVQKTFYDDGCTFTNTQVLKIFKKIAGVNGTPIPYIIDFGLYNGDAFTDMRSVNEGGNTGNSFGYVKADTVHELKLGDSATAAHSPNANEAPNIGSDKAAFKLYKLLSCIDPATLYGLYFTKTDGSYGVDDKLNLIYVYNSNSHITSTYNLGGKASGWTDEYFRPNYLSSSSYGIDDIMDDMGWFEAPTLTGEGNLRNATVNDFVQPIGGSDDTKRSGLVFKSPDGIFCNFAASGATKWVKNDQITVELVNNGNSESGGKYRNNVKVNVIRPKNANIQKWRFAFVIDGITMVNGSSTTVSGNVGWFGGSNLDNSRTTDEMMFSINSDNAITDEVLEAAIASGVAQTESAVAGGNTLTAAMISHVNASKNDYHPYRFLVVVNGNAADGSVNRSVVAKMVEYANTQGKGLLGGVAVDCMSEAQFANINVDLNQTYDAICRQSGTSISGYSGYTPAFAATGSDSLEHAFEQSFGGLGVDYITTPQEYYVNFQPSFQTENGWGSYTGSGNFVTDGLKVDNNFSNYINSVSHSDRTLDFKFKVKGADTYTVTVYVDENHNDIFDETSKEKEVFSNCSGTFDEHIQISRFLGKDYVGGFSWKLVISSGSQSISRVGFSACRKTDSDSKQKIKILQIYPTDYKDLYSSSNEDSDKIWSNPLLLLPTSADLQRAKDKGRADITTYNPNTMGEAGGTGLNGLIRYFDDCLAVDVVKHYTHANTELPTGASQWGSGQDMLKKRIDTNNYKSADDPCVKTEVVDFLETTTTDDKGNVSYNKRNNIVINSSILYYYLSKLNDYEIDVTRYSVYGFNNAVKNNEVMFNKKTKKIGLTAGGGDIINADETTTRYVYTPEQIGIPANWEDTWETNYYVTWGSEKRKKYLKDEITGKIYGERKSTENSVEYYGPTRGEEHGSTVKETADFDLVMIGFGNSMDYMETNAIKVITDYLSADGPAFIGNGAVNKSDNNNLGTALKPFLGMTSTSTTGTSDANYIRDEYIPTMMVTNDTLFSHYPYSVNHYMKATAGNKQPYKLDLTDTVKPIVGSFARYLSGDTAHGTGSWGDIADNYYLYKKGSITFCGFGSTWPKASLDQVGGVMTMAETTMIVNALVTTSRYSSSGKGTPPWIDCIDDDRSVVKKQVKDVEDDEVVGASAKWKLFDGVYTNYDSLGIAHYGYDTTNVLFDTKGIEALTTSELGVSGSSTTSTTDIPRGLVDVTNKIRWIPYQATLVTDNAYISFYTMDNKPVALDVYQLTNSKTLTKLNSNGGSNRYLLDKNGLYYIGIPLESDNSKYSGISSSYPLGFKLVNGATDNSDQFKIKFKMESNDSGTMKDVETHEITMVRRVLYPVK